MDGGVRFFLLVLFLYLLVFLGSQDIAGQVFFNFIELVKKIIPLLFLVLTFMVVADMLFTKKRTLKYLGEKSGIKSWLYAMIAGILISGPPYILYPMLGDLQKKGMRNSLIAVLLFNRNVKIGFMPVLIFYFGSEYTIILSIYIIIFSVFNGLLIAMVADEKK